MGFNSAFKGLKTVPVTKINKYLHYGTSGNKIICIQI